MASVSLHRMTAAVLLLGASAACQTPSAPNLTDAEASRFIDGHTAPDAASLDMTQPRDGALDRGAPMDGSQRDEGAPTDAVAPPRLDASPQPGDAEPMDAALDLGRDAAPDAAPDAARLPDRGPPREICANRQDDDGDDRVDCEDPDCLGSGACFHVREICDDGRDNTGDDRVDCDDVFCHRRAGCPPPDVAPFTTEELQERFDEECVACHGPPQPDVNLDLSAPFAPRVVGVLATELDMDLVAPGKPDESWLYQKIRYRQLEFMGDGEGMPPEHPWSAIDAERLALWIDAQEEPE